MKFHINGNGYVFERNNGEMVKLSNIELGFLSHESEKIKWRNGILDGIDADIDNLCFTDVTMEELVEECMADIEDDWELDDGFCDPDYSEYVFDNAQIMGIWRD